jgi:hypothetical protein
MSDSKLNAGDIFRCKRGFRRPPEGYKQDAWWTASNLNPATAEGREYLGVVEVVHTATLGRLVLFCEWWVDPDGNEIEPSKDWIPDRKQVDIRAESSLCRSVTSKKLESVVRGADAINEKVAYLSAGGVLQ